MARPITKLKDIESTAIRLFATRRMTQVTVKTIAEEAGCAEGALYRHYQSKEEMAWLLFRREVEKFGAQLGKVLHGPGSYRKRIRGGIELFYRFFDKDPETFSFILLIQHDFPTDRTIKKAYNPDSLVLEFVQNGIRDGAFQLRDAPLGSAMVLGLVLHPATMCAKGSLKGPLSRKISHVEKACLAVLQVKPQKGDSNEKQ